MSNAMTNNVIRVDTTGYTNTNRLRICGVKYIGNTSGTASIKADASSSGQILWEESGANNVWNPELEINAAGGIYVTLTNSAVIYIYLE